MNTDTNTFCHRVVCYIVLVSIQDNGMLLELQLQLFILHKEKRNK